MILSFHPCFDTDIQIILGSRNLDSEDVQLIRNAEAIILPQGCSRDLYEACLHSGAQIFPNYEMRFMYPGKLGQVRLSENFGFPHPQTIGWKGVHEFKEAYPDGEVFPHKLPFFVKDDRSHEGFGVFLVNERVSLSEALDYLTLRESSGISGFVSQASVASYGNVLRVVIIGKRVISYWKRPKDPGELITTISRGAKIDHGWRPDLQEKGKNQARIIAGKTAINLAAIDFVFPLSENDPEPFFLEINYYFGRRGLGGMEDYYELLYDAIQDWLAGKGLNPKLVSLV